MTHWLCCVQHSSRQMMIKVTNVILVGSRLRGYKEMHNTHTQKGTANPVKITLRHIYPHFKLHLKHIQFIDALVTRDAIILKNLYSPDKRDSLKFNKPSTRAVRCPKAFASSSELISKHYNEADIIEYYMAESCKA
uniref:Uncharacterized protein n=1 Tax=Glossina austeni TaxID=7395 RepID=A0A1A9V7T5_GLOAU